MAIEGLQEWDVNLSRAVAELPAGQIIKLQRKLVFLALGAAVEIAPGRFRKISGVVQLTPVLTGRARSSWNVSIGEPSTRQPPAGRRYRKLKNWEVRSSGGYSKQAPAGMVRITFRQLKRALEAA